jgi:hypothetical protein
MTEVVVIHQVSGRTATARLRAPSVSAQVNDGAVYVGLRAAAGGPELGWAMFTGGGPGSGTVVLGGIAIEQYGIGEIQPEG